jgi:hypothetical protein
MSTDKDHAWIINETAVKQMGFGTPQKALGRICTGIHGALPILIHSKQEKSSAL